MGKKAGRGPKALKRKLFVVLWLSGLALAGAKYPPGQHWREINRNGFTIIFPAARFMEAETALATAEGLQGKLAGFWRAPFPGRTRVVLDDSTDLANGFATFFPFSLIGVNLAEPPPDSDLAASRGWLDLVLAHELTHLFTMNAGAPLFRAARRLFGTMPVCYPAAQMPPWAIEGLAVHGESRFSGDGRLNHAPYRLMLAAARRDNLFPSWNSLAGLPAAWPGPTAKYLFGAGFMEFLAEKYGADRLRQYLDHVTARLVLVSSSRDFQNTFGAPLGKLWDEYKNLASQTEESADPAPAPLTTNGFSHQYPCSIGDNMLAYYRRDYQSRGEVVRLDLKNGREKPLFRIDAVNGISFAAKENKVYFSAVDQFHAFSEVSDLYEYDMNTGRRRRLSRGQRLSHPARKETSAEIYCVQHRDGAYRLAVFDMQKRAARPLSRPFAGMAQPSLSPGGSLVAAAVKPAGGRWGIGIFSESGGLQAFISHPDNDLSQPRWQGEKKLFFIIAGKETSRLASLFLDQNSGSICDDLRLSGLRQFDLARDGREIYFTYYSGRGQEVARSALENLGFSPLEITVASAIPETKAAALPAPSRPYRFWRDLLPRWWSPALRQSGDELQAGATTSGQDALGIHSYGLEGYYGIDSRRANVLFQYVYDGLFPTLSLYAGDSVEYYRGSDTAVRTRELTLASLWPLRIRKRSQLHAYADLHLEKRFYIDDDSEFALGDMRNGFRLGMRFNSVRGWYDSVSPSDGIALTLQGTLHPSGMGNELASHALQADLRGYISLFRPGVLALRLAAAKNWGPASYYYDMGGLTADGGLGSSRPFRLLRGFETGRFFGNRGWQFNVEYRLPLFRIEKAVLPAVSLDRLWLKPFLDAGRLSSRIHVSPLAWSVGAEAVLRLAFGGAAATDLALGAAHGFGPMKQWQIYLRTGRSF